VGFFAARSGLSLRRPADIAASGTGSAPGDQAVNPGKKNGSADGDQDGVDHSALPSPAQQTHNPSAYDRAGNAEDKVTDESLATAHNLPGCPAGYQANDYPPQ
jgi:hypothetical protein